MPVKTIGFIDEYLDNWHANNYPALIAKSPLGSKFKVAMAWEKRPAPQSGKSADQWCREQQIPKAQSMEQVVGECDCIALLAPRDAGVHEELAELALQSGKPLYVDKPFAPSAAAAQRMFAKAKQYGTPMWSSSALRFGSELGKALAGPLKGQPVRFVCVRGDGEFKEYAIHQIEMLVMCVGLGANRVMQCGKGLGQVMLIDYPDSRRGLIHLSAQQPFGISIGYLENNKNPKTLVINQMEDFFPRFIDAMLAFFDTGQSPAPAEQTVEIAAILEAGVASLKRPDEWVAVPAR